MKKTHNDNIKVVIRLLNDLKGYVINSNCEDMDIEINETTSQWIQLILKEHGYKHNDIQNMLKEKKITLQESMVIEHLINILENEEVIK